MEIEIDISNPSIFASAAFILDQEDVLVRIKQIRKSWNIEELIPYEDFEKWLNEPHIDINLTPEAAQVLNSATEQFETDSSHGNISLEKENDRNRQLLKVRVIDYELEYSLHKFNLDLIFKLLLLRAIVCNKVTEEDFPQSKKIPKDTKQYFFKEKDGQMSEAKSTQKYRKVHFFEEWIYDGLYSFNQPKNIPLSDTKPEIARDREWYWLHKSGKSYLQIAKGADDRGSIEPDDYRDNVKKQVKRYEQFLKGGHLTPQ